MLLMLQINNTATGTEITMAPPWGVIPPQLRISVTIYYIDNLNNGSVSAQQPAGSSLVSFFTKLQYLRGLSDFL